MARGIRLRTNCRFLAALIMVFGLCNVAFATGRLDLAIQDIPDLITDRLIIVIDGGVNGRIELVYSGGGSMSHTADLPAGSDVRVRVVASRASNDFLNTSYVSMRMRLSHPSNPNMS